MAAPGATGELELVPVATTVPSIAVLYRSEHVPLVRRLVLIGAPVDLAESIAHHAFRRVGREWAALADPLTALRRVSLSDALSRFRPVGKAPTRTPPRDGAPPEWNEVGPVLDPLTPAARAAAVLRLYDGLDDEGLRALLPGRRRGSVPSFDARLAIVFAEAVSDVQPASRLTELLRTDLASAPLDSDVPVAPRPPRSGGRWMGVAVAALAVVGLMGGRIDADIGTPSVPDQELRTGVDAAAGQVSAGADASSCPDADPIVATSRAAGNDPRRVARVIATDRQAIVALHRGARDARVLGPTIQVVIGASGDCPDAPEGWKGVPLVFTTAADARNEADVVQAGTLGDGTRWEVRDRPGLGLCPKLGAATAACGSEVDAAERLAPARVLVDPAGRRLLFGYLPLGAQTVRLQARDGTLGPVISFDDGAMFFTVASAAGERPDRVRFFDSSGAAVASVPYPDS